MGQAKTRYESWRWIVIGVVLSLDGFGLVSDGFGLPIWIWHCDLVWINIVGIGVGVFGFVNGCVCVLV